MRPDRQWAPIIRMVLGAALAATALPARGEAAVLPVVPRPAPANQAAPGRPANNPPQKYWQDELVDGLGDVGHAPSMALDPSGHPYIAYYDFTHQILKCAFWDGVAWSLDVVDTHLGDLDSFSNYYPVRSGIGVAGGTVSIVYEKYDASTGRRSVQVAQGGLGSWHISALDNSAYAYAPNLKLDHAGAAHVSYTVGAVSSAPQTGGQSVMYASHGLTATAWVTQTVDRVNTYGGIATSLAFGPDNLPQIAYGDSAEESYVPIVLARWGGSAWLTHTVAASGYIPSLAVDSADKPRIAYLDSHGVQYSWLDTTWQTVNTVPSSDLPTGLSLALDPGDNPFMAVAMTSNLNFPNAIYWVHKSDATHWAVDLNPIADEHQDEQQAPAVAYDLNSNAHVSYFDSSYQDLHYLVVTTDWVSQAVGSGNTGLAGEKTRLALDRQKLPYIGFSTSQPPQDFNVSLANWTFGGPWQVRPALSFPAADQSFGLWFDAYQQPVPMFSYRDASSPSNNGFLGFAHWDGATFARQTVDGTDGAGNNTSLAFDANDNPFIGYVEKDWAHGGQLYIKLAASTNGGQTWRVVTDTAAPALGANSGLLGLSAGGAATCCNEYVAYYESASKTLRLATWNGLQWTDELVDGGNGDDVGRNVSLAVDTTTGKPAMAYVDVTQAAVRYAYWHGAWLTRTVDIALQGISEVSLALTFGSDQYPIVAYTSAQKRALEIATAEDPSQGFTIYLPVGTFSSIMNSRLSLQLTDRAQIAFSQPAAGVLYFVKSATLPLPRDYNPLQPCLDSQPGYASFGPALARVRALAPAALAQIDDLTTLRALRDLFALSPAGRHYIDLYYQFSKETGAIGLADPALLWDSYRTLQNLLPGFLALAAGQGDSIVITPAMVDQANNIADRLKAAGSPALKLAIALERGKYLQLQVFKGKTFAEAAMLMGINAYRAYLPLVRH